MVVPKSWTAANIQAKMMTQFGPTRLPRTTAGEKNHDQCLDL